MRRITSPLRSKHSHHRPLLPAVCCNGSLHACQCCYRRDLAPSPDTSKGAARQRSMCLPCLQARLLEIHSQTRQLRQQREGQQVVLAINRSDYMLDEPSSTLLQVGLLLPPSTAQHWLQEHTAVGHVICSRPCYALLCVVLQMRRCCTMDMHSCCLGCTWHLPI